MSVQKVNNDISSPFVHFGEPVIQSKWDDEYVHYLEKDVVVDPESFDSSHPDEFLLDKVVEEYERIPIREHINSFASKVGLKNELKGIISKQQMDDYISEHKAKPGFVDLTKLPDTQFEMEKLYESIDSVWDSVPSELRGNMTKEEFLKSFTSDKLKDYVLGEIAKKESTEKKEGEN